jgi:hypothetical protein
VIECKRRRKIMIQIKEEKDEFLNDKTDIEDNVKNEKNTLLNKN